MKSKTLAIIISSMVFGMALLTGIVVIAIVLISNSDSLPAGRNIEQPSEQALAESQIEFVYLLDSQNLNLLRVSTTDGTSQTFSLGLPTDESVYLHNLSFSDDGQLVAFCANERISNSLVTRHLIIRDIAIQENLLEIPFGNIPGCEASAFNSDKSEVAVGIVFNSPIEGTINFPNEPNWSLRTFDIATGTVTHDLNADSANAPDYESMTTDFWFSDGISAMTRAVSFTKNEILLTAFPYIGRDGPPRIPAHRWDLNTGAVTPVHGLTHLGSSYLQTTGEIVYPELDANFTVASPIGPIPEANTIRIDDNGDIRTIYRNSEAIIANTTFINGGRQVVALLIPGFDPNNPEAIGQPRYEIINRDGSLGQVSSDFFSYNQVYGTANGLIMMSVSQLGAQGNEYHLVSYANDEITELWSDIAAVGTSFSFAWSPPMPVANELPAFAVIN